MRLNITYLSIGCFIVGMLFVAIQKEWVILRFNPHQPATTLQATCCKQTTTLYFWKNDSWQQEQNDILWGPDLASNFTNLIQSWLVLLEEEKITRHKITLQSALITPNLQTIYLSFDQSLFSQDFSTYQKLLIIEGLLKTLRYNHLTVPNIQILVQHKIAKDTHLDFSNPWPLTGFLNI